MDVGTTLRTARERRDLLLNDLSATTKIPVRLLLAIEENEFHKVPSGIFIRGYLRAFAREVGLDPDAIIEQYREESGEAAPPVAAAPTPELHQIEDDEIDEPRIDPNATGSGPGWGYVLIVAALLVAIISFNRGADSDVTDIASAAPDATETVAAEPAAAAAAPEELLAVATGGTGVRFDFEAQGLCWVEAVVDGRKVVYRLMQPGERETITPERDIVLRVGDPAAFSYSVNGKPGEPLGKPGIPATVRFTTGDGRLTLAS